MSTMSAQSPADDATTLLPGADEQPLPAGARLAEFEILSVIGHGGFGIVYRVFDHSLERTVALKEYMPARLAQRVQGMLVRPGSARHEETFRAGMRSFINEARLLAHFDHPALLKVYRFWEANGTAYMAMPLYQGRTLKQYLRQCPQAPDEAWLRKLLWPLLDALETMHAQHCYHRDISPDNIQVLEDGRPLLLDFGAARRAIGDLAQDFTVILKPGYAPIEQYAEDASLRQGPWTDIYALACVLHFAMLGKAPAPAVTRLVSDPQVPLTHSAAGLYDGAFLAVLDRALAVRPEDRPRDIGELRALLARPPSALAAPMTVATTAPASAARTPGEPPAAAPLVAMAQSVTHDGQAGNITAARPAENPAATMSARRSRRRLGPGLGAALLASILGMGAVMLLRQPAPPDRTDGVAVAPAAVLPRWPQTPSSTTASAPAVMATTATTTAAAPASSTTAPSAGAGTPAPLQPSASAAVPAAAQSLRASDPVDILEQVYQARNSEHLVDVALEKPQVRIGRDQLRFTIRSSRSGYAYLMMAGSDRSQFYLLFPNKIDSNNAVNAGQPLRLPRRGWRMDAAGPPGIDHFVVIVSETARDFSAAGLRPGDPFAEFAPPLRGARTGADGLPLHAGEARCPPGPKPCTAGYGAASFAIEELAAA